MGTIAAFDGTIYCSLGRETLSCKMSDLGGRASCIAAAFPYPFYYPQIDGEWLLGIVSGPPERLALARIHREATTRVEFLAFVEDGEWVTALSAGSPEALCTVVRGNGGRGLVLVPRAGGRRAVLVPFGQVNGDVLGCDKEHAYYEGKEGLTRIPIAGGAAVPLGVSAYRLSLSERELFLATSRGIERVPKGSTERTLLAQVPFEGTVEPPVGELRAVLGGVAWVEMRFSSPTLAPTSALRRCRLPAGCETLQEGPEKIESFAVDGDLLYWVIRDSYDWQIYAARGPAH